MSNEFNLVGLGFSCGLLLASAFVEVHETTKTEATRQSIFEVRVEPAETVENEREEVIESGAVEESGRVY